MNRMAFILLGVFVIGMGGWAVSEIVAADLNPRIERPWLCPTQLYLKADLSEINHPDLFKWRFSKEVEPEAPRELVQPPEEKEPPQPPERGPEPEELKPLPEKIIYFDYDKSLLKPSAKAAIQKNVQFLKSKPEARVLIEGHCDERGSSEYNLALGERRAEAVKSYMVELGIDADRISTKSLGEEQPVEMGHNEAAWSKNRRAEMFFSEE